MTNPLSVEMTFAKEKVEVAVIIFLLRGFAVSDVLSCRMLAVTEKASAR